MIDNILRVSFKHERRIESRPLYQYDYGQVLKFIDLELPYSYEVHFSNHEKGSSITQLGNENGVAIPDSLLTSGLPIYAWLYLHTGDADGETEYMVKIPVYKRAAITNDQPTPVQQDVITQTIAALASGVAVATASASNAMDAATEATRACGGARAYMETTQEYRDAAIAATSHYPKIEDDYWYVWDIITEQFINTDVPAKGPKGEPFTYDDFTPEQLEALTGPQGATFTPSVSSDGVISWTNDRGKENPSSVSVRGPQGIQGETGPSGFSPVIAVSSIVGGHQVSITDASGTQSFDVMDGVGDVQSVNNKTGAVVLTAEDVGALPSDTEVGDPQNVWFGTCDTSSGSTYKYIRISGDKRFVYKDGRILVVYFTNSNTTTDIKLAIYYSETLYLTYPVYSGNNNNWRDRETVIFICRNGYFYMVENGEASTTYYGITKLSNSINSTSTTLAATPYAVKTAYDKGNTAYNQATDALALASNAISQASNAYALAETKVTAEEAAAAAPVQSVNNQTGNITLTAADIGALSSDTALPSKTSDLTNDSGFIASSGTPSVGQVLMYNNGAWEPMLQEKSLQLPYQLIPLSFDGTNVSTTITPQDISEGYTLDGVDYPPYLRSSFTKANLLGSTILLMPVYGNTDGYEFQSGIFDLTPFGFTGLTGLLRIETYNGHFTPYQCTLVTWPASYPTPADIGAIAAPSSAADGQLLKYNGTSQEWENEEPQYIVEGILAETYALTVSGSTVYLAADFSSVITKMQTSRKVLFVATEGFELTVFEPVYADYVNKILWLFTSAGLYHNYRIALVDDGNGGMSGTVETIDTGYGKIDAPSGPSTGDVLTFDGSFWVGYPNPVPAVTSADDGKIMQVVNGAWAAVSLPSASGVSF